MIQMSQFSMQEPQGSMTRVVIDTMEWHRIRMRLAGRILDPVVRTLIGPTPDFFVVDTKTEQQVSLARATCDGDRFVVECNAMRLDGLSPLLTGEWALFVRNIDATEPPIPVGMAENMTIPARAYGGFFTTGAYRYWVVPSVVCETGQFALAICSRKTPRAPRPPGIAGLTRDLKDRSRDLRIAVYTATYATFRRFVRKNGHRILFTSDSRRELSGNLQHIHARMLERGLDRDYRVTTAFKPSIRARRSILDKFVLPYRLATADIILLDDFHPMLYLLKFDPDVRIIQVWHASGAFKTVGYSRIGKPGSPSPFSSSHKNYTHAIVSSEHDVPFYAEAYGLPEERIVATGIPRMDLFFDEAYKSRAIERIYAALPRLRGSRVILFAPTFRGAGPSDAYYDYDRLDLAALYTLCEEQDSVVVFKMHPFVRRPLTIPQEFADRFIDATISREINELLLIADLVITDYSSVVFEYSTLKRPMLFFAYDLEEYIASRDFYDDFVEFVPGKIVKTFSALLEALRTGDFEVQKVEQFAATHLRYLDAGSTDRVIDQLILESDTP